MDNSPYYTKRDTFYYFIIADKAKMRDNRLAELFGDDVSYEYFRPGNNTDKIYCAKFWKDYNSIVRAKNPNLEVQSISRDKWINLIQENVGSVDPWYIKNLKRKRKEIKDSVLWNEFRKKYKATPAYVRVTDPSNWLPCKNCGLIPLVWEFNNGLRTACGCGKDEYEHFSIEAESVMSYIKRNNGSAVGYQNFLNMNWNQWVRTGQDIFKEQKLKNPNLW